MINIRYKYAPQMEFYDKMPSGRSVPYAIYTGAINYNDNKCIKTDKNGFRYSKYNDRYISIEDISNFNSVNILVGGSTVFGVGSSKNDTTISSLLSIDTKEPWINLGLRACNSLQEYIYLIQYISKNTNIKNIVFFSGINDIYLNYISDDIYGFDPMFNSISYKRTFYGCKKRFVAYIISKIKNVSYDYLLEAKSIKEMLYMENMENKDKTVGEFFIKQLTKIYERNFILYNGLKSSLDTNVVYILQPYAYWTQKKFSKEEKEIFKILEQSNNKVWKKYKDNMTQDIYKNIINNIFEKLSSKNKIKFINSNPFYNKSDFLFVDSVHLNDCGNKLAKEIILDNI